MAARYAVAGAAAAAAGYAALHDTLWRRVERGAVAAQQLERDIPGCRVVGDVRRHPLPVPPPRLWPAATVAALSTGWNAAITTVQGVAVTSLSDRGGGVAAAPSRR